MIRPYGIKYRLILNKSGNKGDNGSRSDTRRREQAVGNHVGLVALVTGRDHARRQAP
jgi:hypothetical protein